jgi:hypothetical protein
MAGLGGFVSGMFGSTNEYKAEGPKVDPGAYQYGGWEGGANEAASRYRNQADQAQGRQGVQANVVGTDYSQANASRQGQSSLAQAMNARAMGQTPSVAQMQADRQMQQSNAAQASAGASARGAAGIAMAQQNAANNTANGQAAISNQAQINAVNERMQAEQAAFGAYGNMRGQDTQQAQFDTQSLSQQGQFNAQMQNDQRSRNDAMTMGMTQNEMGVQNTQLAGRMNQQSQQSANQLGAAQIQAAVAAQNAQTNQQNGQSLLGSAQSAAGALLADGGPMKAGAPKPYLVGERGPELVVPKKDGYVIPAEITQKLAARGEGGPVTGAGDVVTSTWGVGKGMTQSMVEADNWKRDQEIAQAAIDRRELDSRLATSGGMAVPGGAGSGVSADAPLVQADQEAVALARAKEAQGAEVSGREAYDATGAEYRLSQRDTAQRSKRKADAQKAAEADKPKATLADHMKQSGSDWQKRAAAVDTGYHGPTGGYVPPHLLQIAGPRANGGPMQGAETDPRAVMPSGSMGSMPSSLPMTPFGGGGQSIANPAGHGSALGRLSLVHDMPSIAEVNKATFQTPGSAALMAPGSGVATHGHNAGSVDIARAEGGPVEGSGDVVPLYSPPGQWLQSTPEGRAYYISEPKQLEERIDPSRPSLAKAMNSQPKDSPIAARAPVALPPEQRKQRKMSDDELMAWADKLQADMRSDHDQRMAQGPSVSLSSRMRAK